ncbi:sn-glycerol-3-phosphate ABC transporter permease UgpA [Legionella dresdenensis]|uniref:sn-glycerol-3-phosphate transport system permease protein UgpA n=1 Tax=Legionella dresdenensis TaxID=450200 RepID=A0ABV8CCP8_9GAMM
MSKFTHNKKIAYAFIAPQLIITLVLFIWPACGALLQSFYYADAFGLHRHFAGLGNFIDLAQDPGFFKAVQVTFIMAFFITLITMAVGLLLAALVNNRKKSQPVYKTLLLWPYAVAPAVAALLWRFLCQPSIGWLAEFCRSFGYEFNYLNNPKQALIVVIIAASWQQLSYNFLFFFAALKAIPQSLLEAATLDGASVWQRFWQIIFPLLSPISFFLLIINFIYSFFDTFGVIDVLTGGGPASSTATMIYKIYKDGFIGMDPGGSAAQSVILMILVGTLTLLQFRYVERRVHYT